MKAKATVTMTMIVEKMKTINISETISSDDAKAIEKIQAKIEVLEMEQTFMKECNKVIKNAKLTREEKVTYLKDEATLKEENAIKLLEPDFCGRLGFPDYKLTNNNGNIRRLKQRLEQLQKNAGDETSEKEVAGVRVVDNVEENRLQLFFTGKPDQTTINDLKSGGWHWSPTNGCWQRFRGKNAEWSAKELLEIYAERSETATQTIEENK